MGSSCSESTLRQTAIASTRRRERIRAVMNDEAAMQAATNPWKDSQIMKVRARFVTIQFA
jgi:hypothetical protein